MRVIVVAVAVASLAAAACGHPATPRAQPRPEGNVHRAIRTTSAEAQRHFDRGLAHAYGFNFDAAKIEFTAALVADPSCAMCTWGLAYAAGPNINERDKRWPDAAENAAKAVTLAKDPVERALADALVIRYSTEHPYADAMRTLVGSHPGDDDVAVLLAEALMLDIPIGTPYWPPSGPTPGGATAARLELERVLARSPDHIGAIHFYIHLMEDSTERATAIPYADKLATLAPGAGHLIHMASHLYLRVGRYADAEDANRKAMAADAAIIPTLPADATYTQFAMHPQHFLWQTLLWEGEQAAAHEVMARIVPHLHHMAMMSPGSLGQDGVVLAFTAIRFGEWDDALALEMPTLPVGAFATHFARGLAFTAKKQLDAARAELAALNMDDVPPKHRPRMQAVAETARAQLSGAIAFAAGDTNTAVSELQRAVALDDALDNPLEPPLWIFPARQRLGTVFLALGRDHEAAKTFEEDLVRHPENGWSLFGLATALEALHGPGAPAVRARFTKAWARSDIKLTSAVF